MVAVDTVPVAGVPMIATETAEKWLRVLGSSGGCPGPGRSCPGYLVGAGDHRILLDCGPGVVSRLREVVDYSSLDAVVISHLHADHFLDLVPYAYGLMMDLIEQGPRDRVPLFLPPGGEADLRAFDRLLGHGGWQISSDAAEGPGYPALSERMSAEGGLLPAVFAIAEYEPGRTLGIGELELEFVALAHTVPSYGIRVSHGGHVLAYTGDTRDCPEVVELAAGADLLLCDASLSQRGCATFSGHMTAAEAGAIAAVADVGRLVLTHVFDQDDRRSRLHDEAVTSFVGLVDVAEEHGLYPWA